MAVRQPHIRDIAPFLARKPKIDPKTGRKALYVALAAGGLLSFVEISSEVTKPRCVNFMKANSNTKITYSSHWLAAEFFALASIF